MTVRNYWGSSVLGIPKLSWAFPSEIPLGSHGGGRGVERNTLVTIAGIVK